LFYAVNIPLRELGSTQFAAEDSASLALKSQRLLMNNNLSNTFVFRIYNDFSDVFVQIQAKHLNKLFLHLTFKVYLLN
jgi:hypothetical protein